MVDYGCLYLMMKVLVVAVVFRLRPILYWLYLEARVVDWFVPVLRIRNMVTAKFVFYIN